MDAYYVNKRAQLNGEHEVHKEGCSYMPDINNRMYLGRFSNCREAIRAARMHYTNVDGCFYCCNECHKR